VAIENGVLYIVATPIGNLGDMTARAIDVLRAVDVIAAEDTRHSLPLLRHFGIKTPLLAFHEHNERDVGPAIIRRLQEGQAVALISDAGTPLISDPGYQLVRLARDQGIKVSPVPGASALIAALSVAGLPTDRFVFEGFLPARAAARQERLKQLRDETRTLVFYESSHRIVEALRDMAEVFGAEREAVLVRELTKRFETVRGDSLGNLCRWVQDDVDQQKGEFVLLVHGAPPVEEDAVRAEAERILRVLLEELPVKQAVGIAVRLTGLKKNLLYQQAVRIQDEEAGG